MLVSFGLDDHKRTGLPSAIAIGIFDGIHVGHRRIIARLLEDAGRAGLCPTVLTFHPHPEQVLGTRPMFLIDTLDQRLARLEGLGIGSTIIIPFDRDFSELSGTVFVREILAGRLGARRVVVGRKFRFGRKRRSDLADLTRLCRGEGIKVRGVPPVVVGGRTASSTLVRTLIRKGAVEEAADILARPYELTGKVVKGDGRGRELGFPTANLKAENEIRPEGVFASVAVAGDREFQAVTFIGASRTFGRTEPTVETHIPGFKGDLLGGRMTLRLLTRIRQPAGFRSARALIDRIHLDIQEAENYFRSGKG